LIINFTAFAILVAASTSLYLLYTFSPRFLIPSMALPTIESFSFTGKKSLFLSVFKKLHIFAFVCLAIAFIDPRVLLSSAVQKPISVSIPKEGLAIYLLVDQSGSMGEPIVISGANQRATSILKINFLKEIASKIVSTHPNDIMGLVSFARIPKVVVPLTLDHSMLLHQLEQIKVINQPENDGTAIGYAIFKTIHLIEATRHFSEKNQEEGSIYQIKDAAIIVITDGFQDPNRLDQGNRLRTIELEEASAYAKTQNIHLYMIAIDPIFSSSQYLPHLRQLHAITNATNGKFLLVTDLEQLHELSTQLNKLQKTIFKQPSSEVEIQKTYALYPFFILLGLCSLGSFLLIESFIFKQVP
jgi:Ca-activated chloride channel family protein